MMKPQSAKNKGRLLQQWVVKHLLRVFSSLSEDDITSRSMGAGGEDVLLSPEARRLFPYSIECKSQERGNVWNFYDQAVSNSGEHEPLLIIKKNRRKPLAVVDAEYFIRMHKT